MLNLRLPDMNVLPLYGCVTGIALPVNAFRICEGVEFCKGVFEIFSTPMLAFAEPSTPGTHTPGPWVAVHGGFAFESRVQLAVHDLAAFDGFLPSEAMWLVAALLRLQVEAPVRISAVANMPLASLPEHRDVWALAFEASPSQVGLYRTDRADLESGDLEGMSDILSMATRLFHEERFNRAFTLYDSATWADRLELATTLLWTSVEVLFDLGAEQHKTKVISSVVAEYISQDAGDRDRAYGVIRDLYGKRGSIVHAGRRIDQNDFIQTYSIVRAVFRNVIRRKSLPPTRRSAC